MKTLLNLLALFLIAVGANAQTVLYEKDYTGITEFTGWYGFSDTQTDGKVEVDPNGVAITVGTQTGELWQPQVLIVPDGSFDLEEGCKYTVVITAKFPTAGTLQINMGLFSSNDEATFPVEASDDFQTIECVFNNWSLTAEGAHLFFQCGDFKGTTIVKKIKIIGQNLTPYNPDDICYNFITKGKVAEVISNPNKKYKGIIEIPATVTHEGETYAVSKIANNAFSDCKKLTSVTIPNSVTSIGNSAFVGCSGLTSVTIPNSVTTISDYTFSGCSGLTSITISNCVTSIGSTTFANCKNLTSVNFPNSVTSIDNNAFYNCTGLTSVTIPNSVTSIGSNVFQNCSSLESISIGSGMKSIGSGAFANCSKLTDVYCLVEKISDGSWNSEGIYTTTDAFDGSYIEYATLHVPAASLNNYMNTEPWKKFQSKVAINNGENPETPKCAKPEISFVNGKVSFSCATEGVEYISEVTLADTHKYYDSEIQLSQKYKVSVYATKTNYINSDVTTREIIITGNGKAIVVGDVDGDGKVNVADHVKLSDIILEK